MKCDFCGCETENNYFPDAFTILCKGCAQASGILGGQQAVDYINKKSTKGVIK